MEARLLRGYELEFGLAVVRLESGRETARLRSVWDGRSVVCVAGYDRGLLRASTINVSQSTYSIQLTVSNAHSRPSPEACRTPYLHISPPISQAVQSGCGIAPRVFLSRRSCLRAHLLAVSGCHDMVRVKVTFVCRVCECWERTLDARLWLLGRG